MELFGKFVEVEFFIRVVASFDPNEKFGSHGATESRYLSGAEPLRYSVFFENQEEATAPAQEVVVTDQLDTENLDLSTLSLGPIAFSDYLVIPEPGLTEFATDIMISGQVLENLIVRITASLNLSTGLLTWRLKSIDPATGTLPDNPLEGFLPPNINPPEGDGSVLFSVMPKESLPTGTEIRNQASIIFDTNDPIVTPEWLNTLDNTSPESRVTPLDVTQRVTDFMVEWSGADEGAGIQNYSIFVSEDDGPSSVWLSNTSNTSGMFMGENGKKYAFYSVAQDQTGNIEEAPTEADTMTTIMVSELAITATATGNAMPPTVTGPRGTTVTNGDFLITRTGADDTIGNGLDEETTWTFDFTADPNFPAFPDSALLESARLTLTLRPTSTISSPDSVYIEGLPEIPVMLQNLPVNVETTIELELLDVYSSRDILNILNATSSGRIPMVYTDDAIVSFAQLDLVVGTE